MASHARTRPPGRNGKAALWLALLVASFPLARPAAAHDFWIVPSSFHPQPGSTLYAALRVGQELQGEAVPRNDLRIQRFALVGPDGASRPLRGRPASDPAGGARIESSGLHWIVYESRPSVVDLEPEKVARYAEQEGLSGFLGLAQGAEPPKIRDHFARCAKALVAAGLAGADADGFDRPLGLPLELVPEANPYALGAGEGLSVRLLRDGEPLAGALVVALSASHPERAERVRTDAEGRARLELASAGPWLVKAVHIEPLAGAPGQWSSLWASITFEVPEAGGP